MKSLLPLFFCVVSALSPVSSVSQQPPVGTGSPSVEKKLKELPPGSLFWRIENFLNLDQAKAAAGPTGLATEFSGKVWLFTLGPKAGATPGATKVTEVGPLPPIQAPEYLLRIMNVNAPPGWRSPEHSHPGSESFYVLKGRVGHKSQHGTHYADAEAVMNSHGADTPMQVFTASETDVELFAMFVVDATRPFSSPAKLD
jgi:quercetin dioxygenase-like cupin family protein